MRVFYLKIFQWYIHLIIINSNTSIYDYHDDCIEIINLLQLENLLAGILKLIYFLCSFSENKNVI